MFDTNPEKTIAGAFSRRSSRLALGLSDDDDSADWDCLGFSDEEEAAAAHGSLRQSLHQTGLLCPFQSFGFPQEHLEVQNINSGGGQAHAGCHGRHSRAPTRRDASGYATTHACYAAAYMLQRLVKATSFAIGSFPDLQPRSWDIGEPA